MDFFKVIFHFFFNKEYSIASKFVGLISIVLILFFIDNYLGFSFYYSNNQKLTQIKTIETLKKDCKNNEEVFKLLNETEKEIINRRNIVENFFNLFSKEPLEEKKILRHDSIPSLPMANNRKDYQIDSSKTNNETFSDSLLDLVTNSYNKNDTNHSIKSLSDSIITKQETCKKENQETISDTIQLIDSINNHILFADSISKTNIDTIYSAKKGEILNDDKPHKVRSKLWHTVSSSYILLLLLLILPFVPFSDKKFSWNTVAGVLAFMLFDAGLIWLNQYLFGLIPLILSRPWINYTLNVILHTILTFWFVNSLSGEDNNDKKDKNAT